MQEQHLDKLNGLKIIIVDDNVQFRSVLRKLLEFQFACEIIAEVSNGEEFLALTSLPYVDIVILDLMMPQLDGYKTMKIVNTQFPNLKVIALTMQNENVYLRRLIELGFKGCLFKYNIYECIADALLAILDNKLYFPDELIKRKIN